MFEKILWVEFIKKGCEVDNMGKAISGIQFGKIHVYSDGASLDDLEKVLARVIEKHSYPEQQAKDQDEVEIDELLAKREEEADVEGEEIPVMVEEAKEEEAQNDSPWMRAIRKRSDDGAKK